jgi:succinyl-CoA synthetase beta subunit
VKLHEYQAKARFAAAGLPVPRGEVVDSPRDARAAYARLGGDLAVVKAQIHAGGRGKGGGVRLVRSADEAHDAAKAILGVPLVTPQTGPKGTLVRKVLVEEGLPLLKEYYAAVTLDRQRETPVLMASAEGGMDIEEVAAKRPEAILTEPVDPSRGLADFRARRLVFGLGVARDLVRPFTGVLQRLARVFLDGDASLVEVNPLVSTKDGRVVCLDGKMSLDDNALFRHPELEALRDEGEEDPTESRARKAGLSYVKLDGDIGCLVNGAGLAMATMDIIQHHGGQPANFLDVGGSASAEQVKTAFEIILEDRAVRAILVNIFGGIMRCDVVAQGVVEATRALQLAVPLVVRLHGTNVEEGRAILEKSGLPIRSASDMAEAAQKVVEAVA